MTKKLKKSESAALKAMNTYMDASAKVDRLTEGRSCGEPVSIRRLTAAIVDRDEKRLLAGRAWRAAGLPVPKAKRIPIAA